MASEIEIKFTGVPSVNQTLNLAPNINLRFVTTRSKYGEVTTGTPGFDILTFQSKYLYDAFRVDFDANGAGVFTQQRESAAAKLIIQHPNDDFFNGATTTSSVISLTVRNIVKPKPIPFTLSFSEDDQEPKSYVKVTVTASKSVDQIYLFEDSVSVGGPEVNTTTLIRRVRRDKSIKARVTHDGIVNEQSFKTPPNFGVADVIVEGSIAKIIPTTSNPLLKFTYSIGDEYQSSNIFTGLTPAGRNAYIKDQYGAVQLRFFRVVEVPEGTVNFAAPYFDVPAINDFRFVDRTRGNQVNANQFEMLTNEMPLSMATEFYHPIAYNEKYKIQFRSSLSDNFATLVPCDTSENLQELYFEKKSNFINNATILQGNVRYQAAERRLGIFFTPGNVYNEEGDVIDTHDYDHVLPPDYERGMTLFIDGLGQAVITSIFTLNGIEFAILNLNQTITLDGVKIKNISNIYDYDVFEVEVNAEDLLVDDFYIRVGGTDVTWVSERIKVVDNINSLNYHKMIYGSDRNYENNDIHYQWGIVHQRYVPYQKYLDPVPFAEIDILISDDRIDKKDYRAKRVYKMLTMPMPKMIADGLAECFNVSTLIDIDGQQYVNEEGAELEMMGNLAVLSVNLTVARKTLTYNMDEGIFNQDDFYPVVIS